MRSASWIAALAALLLAAPAGATVLYKSVSPKGVIEFSDTPPGPGMKILEQREIQPEGAQEQDRLVPAVDPDTGTYTDDAIAQAAENVDLAEHALALARRSTWSLRDGLRLEGMRRSPADEARVAYYERKVRAARRTLMALLQRNTAQNVATR